MDLLLLSEKHDVCYFACGGAISYLITIMVVLLGGVMSDVLAFELTGWVTGLVLL